MKLVEGWQVPDIDECCINALLVELPDLNVSYTHLNQFRTVIQPAAISAFIPLRWRGNLSVSLQSNLI